MTPPRTTEVEKDALLPCPCCNAMPQEEREKSEPLDWFRVRCVNVECGMQTIGWGLRSTARKAWNRRPTPAADGRVESEVAANLEQDLQFLANTAGGFSLMQWNPIANNILAAISLLRSPPRVEEMREALRKALSVVKPFGLDDEETKIYREARSALASDTATREGK